MTSSTIAESETAQRIEKLRRLMVEKAVDAAFIYHDELRMSNGCYLTNYWPTIEAGAVLAPLSGEPVLLGGPEAAPYALEVSAIKTYRNVDCFIVPEEEYPGAHIEPLGDVIREVGGAKRLKRLGVVGLDITPYGIVRALQEALPGVELVDITREYTVMRAVKSEDEIALMARAFDIGAEGIRACIPNIRPGVGGDEVLGPAEGRMRSMGADGFNFRSLAGSGYRSDGVVPPASDKTLESGELVLIGFSPKVRGYAAGAAMTFAVDNPPSQEHHQFLIDLADALEYTRDAIRPGMKGKDADAAPRQYLAGKGYGDYLCMGFVHTVGLNEYELPFFGPNSEDVMEENLTFCIDISLFGHPLYHGARHEAGYVLRAHGAEPLSEDLEQLILGLRDPNGEWSRR